MYADNSDNCSIEIFLIKRKSAQEKNGHHWADHISEGKLERIIISLFDYVNSHLFNFHEQRTRKAYHIKF